MHADCLARGEYFLHKVDIRGFGYAQTCRTGNRTAQRRIFSDQRARVSHQLDCLFAYFGKVALIVFVNDLSIAHNNDFNRR